MPGGDDQSLTSASVEKRQSVLGACSKPTPPVDDVTGFEARQYAFCGCEQRFECLGRYIVDVADVFDGGTHQNTTVLARAQVGPRAIEDALLKWCR